MAGEAAAGAGRGCGRCEDLAGEEDRLELQECGDCGQKLHLSCLTCLVPARVLGQPAPTLRCGQCGEDGEDRLTAARGSWLAATLLALYNLHHGPAPGRGGYFHWRLEVCR